MRRAISEEERDPAIPGGDFSYLFTGSVSINGVNRADRSVVTNGKAIFRTNCKHKSIEKSLILRISDRWRKAIIPCLDSTCLLLILFKFQVMDFFRPWSAVLLTAPFHFFSTDRLL